MLPSGAQKLCDLGYSSMDIITTLFRVVRNFPDLAEFVKLEYIRVCPALAPARPRRSPNEAAANSSLVTA